MIDPDPRVSGGGIETIRKAGIEVLTGVEEADCRQLNEGFIHRILHKQPFGILKYAMTLDGKIATTTGHSAWITAEETRNHVYDLRSQCDAVIVGGNTVRLDNPLLTTHGKTSHNPLRVVVSESLNFPEDRHLWDTAIAQTIVITKAAVNPETQSFLKKKGVEIIHLDLVSPQTIMKYLYDRGCLKVLWECGGNLAAQAIADGTVQKIMTFIAPKIIGGTQAPSPVGDLGLTLMDQALALEDIHWQQLGQDFLFEGRLVTQ